ncbi:MAG TPA: DUF3828 domain-containing protein [Blastocatellia bacterium]|nr:DUF3828 domain-containing protein [Blastocatellia bacterium]
MDHPAKFASLTGIALILTLASLPAGAQKAAAAPTANVAVSSFYTFHLARNKDFNLRNVQLRKRFLTPELYGLLVKELNRQAAYSKAHPDEAPYFEGDPFTDSQEYPDSFRVGTVVANGDRAKATVTLDWSAKTSRGTDTRKITVELARTAGAWLIDDIINGDGSSLRAELKKEH